MKKSIIVLLILSIFSCSSSHKIHINKDDSATVIFSVVNKKSLIDTLIEWGAIQNNASNPIIDTIQLKHDLEENKNITNVIVYSPVENKYDGKFTVTNIENLFQDSSKEIPKEMQVFSIINNNGIKTLKIQLSIDNYRYLKESLPMLQEESIDMLGPDANQDVTKEEYLDMMSFSLGDNGPTDIMSSNIDLNISVDGTISSIKGGIIKNQNTAVFSVPLIDLILLQKTLIYSISYK